MSKESNEHISSLMDGEISRETSRFLVRRLGSDQELCSTWARYHLVRDCLRHAEGGFSHEDLCGRVSRALEDEAPPSAVNRFGGWLKPAAGMAIAASVALMAVLTVGPNAQQGAEAPQGLQAEAFTSPQGLVPGPASQTASLNGSQAGGQKMNSYLLRHYQAAGSAGGKSFVTFVPIVVTTGAEPADQAGAREDEAAGDSEENLRQ